MYHLKAILLNCTLAGLASVASGQEPGADRERHAWGRFSPGSWKTVRHEIQDIGRGGIIERTSQSDTKSRLTKASDEGFTVEVETRVEVDGKSFDLPKQSVTQGYNGETSDQKVEVVALKDEPVAVEGVQVPCQVWRVTISDALQTVSSKLFVSQAVSPYLLRRETTATSRNDPTGDYETVMQVIAVEMPYQVVDQIRSAAFRRIVHKDSKGTIVTVEVVCLDVPGEIVAHTSKELDSQGQLVRRSQLKLVDFRAKLAEVLHGSISRRMQRRMWRQERRSFRLASRSDWNVCD